MAKLIDIGMFTPFNNLKYLLSEYLSKRQGTQQNANCLKIGNCNARRGFYLSYKGYWQAC